MLTQFHLPSPVACFRVSQFVPFVSHACALAVSHLPLQSEPLRSDWRDLLLYGCMLWSSPQRDCRGLLSHCSRHNETTPHEECAPSSTMTRLSFWSPGRNQSCPRSDTLWPLAAGNQEWGDRDVRVHRNKGVRSLFSNYYSTHGYHQKIDWIKLFSVLWNILHISLQK